MAEQRVSVCYGCTERHAGCHATCERGLAAEAESRKRREKYVAAKKAEDDASSVLLGGAFKQIKRRKK